MNINKNESEKVSAENKNLLRFTCSRAELLKALDQVSHAIVQKATLPIFEGVLLSVKQEILTLTVYDLTFGIRASVQVRGSKNGEIVMPAKLFTKMLRSLTQDELRIEEKTEGEIVIQCGSASCSLAGERAEDFPVFPEISGTQHFVVSAEVLNEMLRQTFFVILKGDSRWNRQVLFDAQAGELIVAACDGMRLAVCKESIPSGATLKFLMPIKVLKELQKLLAKAGDQEVEFQYDGRSGKYVQIKVDGLVVIARPVEEAPFEYAKLISPVKQNRATVSVQDMALVIKRCGLLRTKRRWHRVKVKFQPEKATISCRAEGGSVEDTIPCSYEGEEMVVEFDCDLLLSVIQEIGGENMQIEIEDVLSPVSFTSVSGGKGLYLVATIRPKAE